MGADGRAAAAPASRHRTRHTPATPPYTPSATFGAFQGSLPHHLQTNNATAVAPCTHTQRSPCCQHPLQLTVRFFAPVWVAAASCWQQQWLRCVAAVPQPHDVALIKCQDLARRAADPLGTVCGAATCGSAHKQSSPFFFFSCRSLCCETSPPTCIMNFPSRHWATLVCTPAGTNPSCKALTSSQLAGPFLQAGRLRVIPS